jgi:hypothetical protein
MGCGLVFAHFDPRPIGRAFRRRVLRRWLVGSGPPWVCAALSTFAFVEVPKAVGPFAGC